MIRLSAAAVLVLAGLALPAQATEWMDCGDAEKTVSIRMLLGAMDVIALNTVEIEAVGKTWSTAGANGATRITTGQAFETADQMWIDVTDENVGQIIARLRLFKAADDTEGLENSYAAAGTLSLPGLGVWAISCSGP
jgi:predicted secreted protein